MFQILFLEYKTYLFIVVQYFIAQIKWKLEFKIKMKRNHQEQRRRVLSLKLDSMVQTLLFLFYLPEQLQNSRFITNG